MAKQQQNQIYTKEQIKDLIKAIKENTKAKEENTRLLSNNGYYQVSVRDAVLLLAGYFVVGSVFGFVLTRLL